MDETKERPVADSVEPSREPDAEAHDDVSPRISVKAATCPLCLDPLTALPQLEVCPTCQTIHHRTCVDEFGRCGTPACHGLKGTPADESQRALATAAHLTGTFGGGFLVPLLFWYLTKEKQPFAAYHAWRAFIFGAASIPLALVTCGVWVPFMVVFSIRAALRARRGERSPYGELERVAGLSGTEVAPKPPKL